MRLTKVSIRLNRPKPSLLKLLAEFADGLPLRGRSRQTHQQGVCELVACLVAVNVGRDHLNSPGIVEYRYEFGSIALALELAKGYREVSRALPLQPCQRLETIRLCQHRGDEDTVNVFLCHWFCGFRHYSAKLRQRLVLRRRSTIIARTDNAAVKIEVIRKQRAVAQSTPAAPAKFTAQRGDFHLPSPVVVPGALNSRAMDHLVFAKQAAGFAPLTAKTVQQTVRVGFFGSEATIFVPDASDAVPLAVSQRQYFAELTLSIKELLNRGSHITRMHFHQPT